MALIETQQIFETIKRASNILVVFRHNEIDSSGAGLAFYSFLKKINKVSEIVSNEWVPRKELQFLPGINEIKPNIENLQKFLIEVDVQKTSIKELSYDIKDNKLLISLVPKSGSWQTQDVKSQNCNYRFDLITILGVPDFKSLGKLFECYADFFYHVPIINIDCDPGNEHYGQINYVDISKTATSEVVFDLIKLFDKTLIDENIATSILAGMIGKTKSFKTPNVTPKTLEAASELVSLGARREEIVHNLYRTRTVPVLRLWGRALARLKNDSNSKLVWTMLTVDDFVHAGADAKNLDGVIDELIINSPEASAVLILYEDNSEANKKIICALHADRPFSAIELCKPFGGTGSRDIAKFEIKDKTLLETETMITESLKQRMKI